MVDASEIIARLDDPGALSHRQLVERARNWLLGSERVRVVVSEWNASTMEHPDAIGWHTGGQSVVIECKASLSDFRADKKKPFRVHESMGMGNKRYFLAPKGLIPVEELPEG